MCIKKDIATIMFNYTLFTVISKLSSNVSETGKSWRDLVCIERHLNDPIPPWGRHNFEILSENEVNIELPLHIPMLKSFNLYEDAPLLTKRRCIVCKSR